LVSFFISGIFTRRLFVFPFTYFHHVCISFVTEQFFLLGHNARWKSADVSKEHVITGSARRLLWCCFSFDLFFGPEDEGDIFLRNVGWLSMAYMVLYSGTLQNYCCENTRYLQSIIPVRPSLHER
jgi:hypothetical protein